jgi:hypothetical protein
MSALVGFSHYMSLTMHPDVQHRAPASEIVSPQVILPFDVRRARRLGRERPTSVTPEGQPCNWIQ